MFRKVYVEITNVCNMHCSFCHGHRRPPRQMSKAEFALVLEKLRGQTEYIYYHLMGEPLTHPQLPEFIAMAKKQGYRSVITTNGTLLSARGEALIAAAPHKVSVSLHSFEEGGEEALLQYLSQTADFADAASRAGIIVVLRLWNRGCDGGQNERIEAFLRDRFDGEWAKNTRGMRIRDKLHLEWGDRFAWPDMNGEIQGERFFCYALADQFGILSDGTVVPCCLDGDGLLRLGNIFEEDIDTILRSARATALVHGFRCGTASEELCRRCGYASRFV